MKFYLQLLTCSHCTNELLAAVITCTRPAQNQTSQNYSMKAWEKAKQLTVPLGKPNNY